MKRKCPNPDGRPPRGPYSCKKHPLYAAWCAMRRRCYRTTCGDYKNYGARGITVCDQWSDFWTFVSDMGERPAGTTLDRIDNDGPYSPSNCRWATKREQAMNSRQVIFATVAGQTLCLTEWAAFFGVHQSSMSETVAKYGSLEADVKRRMLK